MRYWGFVLSLFCSLALYLAFPLEIFATTTATILSTFPNLITPDSAFDVEVKILATANSTFSLKGRIGADSSSLNKGLTNNTANVIPDNWLSDTDSWSKFPTTTTDSTGLWQGIITIKASTSVSVGSNLLIFRIRSSGGTLTDSSSIALTLTDPPSPTPTTIPTPTNAPTQIPSKTPTPAPNDSPSSTPTPKITPSLTPKPTLTISPNKITPSSTVEISQNILGLFNVSPSPTTPPPTPTKVSLINFSNILMACSGIILVLISILSGTFLFKNRWTKA